MVTNESAGLPASEAGPFHTDLEENAPRGVVASIRLPLADPPAA